MPRSTIFYMITINQTETCTVPFEECFKRAVAITDEIGARYVVSREEGSKRGKLHVHICVELNTEKRQDNLKRWYGYELGIEIEKPTIKVVGTAKLPHKDNWEKEAIAYAAKDSNYAMKGFCKEEIDQITPGNETELITQTMMIVSPRNQKVVEETTNMTVLVNGVDYVIYGGLAFINKKRFTIHKYRTVLTGGDAYTYQPQSHRFMWKIPWKKQIKSANSSWLSVTEEEMTASSKLYFITFTNNSGVDLQYPLLNANILINGYA